jgi:hypothetical protein
MYSLEHLELNDIYKMFENLKFKKIILQPPNKKPGSFRGAGALLIDGKDYWLTSRTRTAEKRGYEVEIYHSKNGYDFSSIKTISRKQMEEFTGNKISSIEAQQIIRDPKTGKFYMYVSIDLIDNKYPHMWVVLLLIANKPSGKWINGGIVMYPKEPFNTVKDCNIGIFNGRYIALCKAYIDKDKKLFTTLYTSSDGIKWKYSGIPTFNGKKQKSIFALDGSIYKFNNKIFVIGTKEEIFTRGLTTTNRLCIMELDLSKKDIKTVVSEKWKHLSNYERKNYPIHTYFTAVPDYAAGEWKVIAEITDPRYTKKLGVFDVVDNVIMYTSTLN